MIEFTLGVRLDTLNHQLRKHWSKRQRFLRDLAWMVVEGLGRQRPAAPIVKCRILVQRFSPKRPDFDNLVASVKPLMDVLQPASKRCPVGLGVIANDSRDCVLQLDVEHVPAKVAFRRTAVRIEVVA